MRKRKSESVEEFRLRKNEQSRKYYWANRDRRRAYTNAWRKRNLKHCASYQVAEQRRLKYGVWPDRYAAMVKAQDGLCAICGKPPKKKALAVDHDHISGNVRGLLCGLCNSKLGWYEKLGDRIANYLITSNIRKAS